MGQEEDERVEREPADRVPARVPDERVVVARDRDGFAAAGFLAAGFAAAGFAADFVRADDALARVVDDLGVALRVREAVLPVLAAAGREALERVAAGLRPSSAATRRARLSSSPRRPWRCSVVAWNVRSTVLRTASTASSTPEPCLSFFFLSFLAMARV